MNREYMPEAFETFILESCAVKVLIPNVRWRSNPIGLIYAWRGWMWWPGLLLIGPLALFIEMYYDQFLVISAALKLGPYAVTTDRPFEITLRPPLAMIRPLIDWLEA
jgi:hypothetical protein